MLLEEKLIFFSYNPKSVSRFEILITKEKQ